MNRNSPVGRTPLHSRLWGGLARERLLLPRECTWLLFVSTLDLFVTYLLLRQGGGFYEANPVARWWLVRWNVAGMTAFKFSVVSVAIVASEVVERRRAGLGRGVLWLGIIAACLVIARGASLLLSPLIPSLV